MSKRLRVIVLFALAAQCPGAGVIDVTASGGEPQLRAAIERSRAAGQQGATIRLRGGTYFLDEPIVLTAADSGLTIDAADGETPIISGGRRIAGWRAAKLNDRDCWAADVAEVKAGRWYFRELWINERRATRARRPDKGYFNVVDSPNAGANWEEGQHRIRFKNEDIPAGPFAYGAEAVVMMRWVESRMPLKEVNRQANIATFTRRTQWVLQPNDAYWLEGDPRWMDQPGEWYLDRAAGTLYYIPLPGQSIEKIEAIAPRLSQLIVLAGPPASDRKFIDNVRIRWLSFQHTHWMLPDPDPTTRPVSGGFAQAATPVPAAIQGDGVRNCAIEKCTIAHLGTYGIHLGRGAQYNRIESCTLHDLGAGGVRIGAESISQEQFDQSFQNKITDCRIHDIGRMFPSAVGIWVGQAFENLIAHNEIFDTFYSGISVGWSWGYGDSLNRGNIVEFNRVHHIGKRSDGDGAILSDMGGVYLLGGREGTVVRNNVFHDIAAIKYGGWGIYLDEGCCDVLVENNLVHHTTHGGFHLHYGRENVIRNNIFALGVEQQVIRSREEEHLSLTFERNIVYWSEGQLTKGGPKNVKFDKNLYGPIAPEKFMAGVWNLEQWRAEGQDVNTIFADPGFANAAGCDFSYPPDSPAGKVLRPFDLSTVGVRVK